MLSKANNRSDQQSIFYHPNDKHFLFSTNNVLIERIFQVKEKKAEEKKAEGKKAEGKKTEENNTEEKKQYPIQVNVYLPGYMRAKVKNIDEVDLTNLTSKVNMDLIYDIYLGDLLESDERFKQKAWKDKNVTYEEILRSQFKNDFILNFSRGDPVLLANKINGDPNLEITVKQKDPKQISFTVRKVLSLHMDGNIWLSPFELLNLFLQITVHPLTFYLDNTKYTFRINFMNHPQSDVKLSFPEHDIHFGKYGLAKNLTRVAYTNERLQKPKEFDMTYDEHQAYLKWKNEKKNEKNQDKSVNASTITSSVVVANNVSGLDQQDFNQKIDGKAKAQKQQRDIKYFQYAYFNLAVYKHPIDTIVTVLIPIWLLGTINLGIFFQDQNLNDRLGSIIGLVIALITYIPTIEDTTPPTPNLVMAKLMVYLEIAAVICTFIHSMRIKFETNFRLKWKQTPEYWIAFLLLVLSAAIVLILTIVHYSYWRLKYNSRRYSEGWRKGKIQRSYSEAKYCLQKSDPPNTRQILTDQQYENMLKQACQSKKYQLKMKDWINLDCDAYFNRYFVCEKEKVEKEEKDTSNSEKQYYDYFLIKNYQNGKG